MGSQKEIPLAWLLVTNVVFFHNSTLQISEQSYWVLQGIGRSIGVRFIVHLSRSKMSFNLWWGAHPMWAGEV